MLLTLTRQLEQEDLYITGSRFKQISGLEQEYELRKGGRGQVNLT